MRQSTFIKITSELIEQQLTAGALFSRGELVAGLPKGCTLIGAELKSYRELWLEFLLPEDASGPKSTLVEFIAESG